MRDHTPISLLPDGKIVDAIRIIEEHEARIVLVVDDKGYLVGTVTDGDIRRGLLQNTPMDAPLSKVMNSDPRSFKMDEDRDHLFAFMRDNNYRQMPVVDEDGHILGIEILDDMLHQEALPNWAVIMAGGRGKRLRPLTDAVPKPMLKLGSKPIMEIIMDRLIDQGIRTFYISTNYKSHMIQDYFGDGSGKGVRISYLEEDEPLGTAGSLSLMKERPDHPFLVMNGDVLTRVDCRNMFDFHALNPSLATMCVRSHLHEVPFGVVEVDGHTIVNISEKPVIDYLVNAGIYILEPGVLDFIPKGKFYDMPTLFERIQKEGKKANVFPLREEWRDVGRMQDFVDAITDVLHENK